jgi:type II secretory pathway pseudopilin PulG
LLIVVAIIAILAAIAVPNFLEAQVRSKVSRVKSDMRSIDTALQAYYIDNNRYPAAYERHNQISWTSPYSEPPFHARVPSLLTTPVG